MSIDDRWAIRSLEEKLDASIWDRADSRSVISLVPEGVALKFEKAKELLPDLFSLDEQDLWKRLYGMERTPNATDNRLRLKFWMEYEYAASIDGAYINMARVAAGICTKDHLHNSYLKDAARVAWLLCLPVSYGVKVEEALEFGLDQLRDLLAKPHSHKDDLGREFTDTKLGSLKLGIVNMLDARAKGAVVQKAMTVHAWADGAQARKISNAVMPDTMEALEKRLEDLRKREKQFGPELMPRTMIDEPMDE